MVVSSKVPRALLLAPGPGKVRANFSTPFKAMLAKRPGVPNGNPELPSFRISDIVSTRRGRIIFYSLFAVLATAESLTWFNFAPGGLGEAAPTRNEESPAMDGKIRGQETCPMRPQRCQTRRGQV